MSGESISPHTNGRVGYGEREETQTDGAEIVPSFSDKTPPDGLFAGWGDLNATCTYLNV
jgi:hypothetical protein